MFNRTNYSISGKKINNIPPCINCPDNTANDIQRLLTLLQNQQTVAAKETNVSFENITKQKKITIK